MTDREELEALLVKLERGTHFAIIANLVRTRKPHLCKLCKANIPSGTTTLHETNPYGQEYSRNGYSFFEGWHYCPDCAKRRLRGLLLEHGLIVVDEDDKPYQI